MTAGGDPPTTSGFRCGPGPLESPAAGRRRHHLHWRARRKSSQATAQPSFGAVGWGPVRRSLTSITVLSLVTDVHVRPPNDSRDRTLTVLQGGCLQHFRTSGSNIRRTRLLASKQSHVDVMLMCLQWRCPQPAATTLARAAACDRRDAISRCPKPRPGGAAGTNHLLSTRYRAKVQEATLA